MDAQTSEREPSPDPSSRPKRRRWLMPLLFVSLGVNLFLIGAAVGWVARPSLAQLGRFAAAAEPGAEQISMLRRAIDPLPDAERQRFRAHFEAERDAVAPLRRALFRERLRLRRLIDAEPFDAAAANARLAEIRRLTEAMQARLHAAAVAGFAELSPDSRRAVSRRMVEDMRRGGAGHRDGPPPTEAPPPGAPIPGAER